MPFTVEKTYERSNPIPVVEQEDPAFDAVRNAGKQLIENECKADWFFALEKLVSFRPKDSDPIRRDNCTGDCDVSGALWMVDEDGSVIDAMAEYNQYFKQEIAEDGDPPAGTRRYRKNDGLTEAPLRRLSLIDLLLALPPKNTGSRMAAGVFDG